MRYSTQILGAIASSSGMLIFGNSVGFATIALPQLLNEVDPNVQMDQHLGSWFASILWICGLFLAPLGGILSGKLGRRAVILYFSPLVLLGWILMGVAYNKYMIFTARIITTSCVYLFVPSLGVYISETVEPSIRSTLVILPVCFVASGQFLVWLLGYLVGWRTTAMMVSIPTIVLFTMMYFLPETPYWLVENDRISEARKSLEFYRIGATFDDISDELEEIQEKHRSKMRQKGSQSWTWTLKRFASSAFWKPFLSVGILECLTPLAGFDVHIVYMIPILKDTGYSYNPEIVPIVVGAVRVFCAAFISLFIQRISPKILYSICQFIKTCDMAALGILSFLHTYYPKLPILSYLGWLPMALMVNIIMMRGLGTAPVLQILLAESYPTDIRTQSVGLTDCAFSLIGCVIIKIYPDVKACIGLHGVAIGFVVMGLLNAVWGFFSIPDNRGKSLVKVEEHFEKK